MTTPSQNQKSSARLPNTAQTLKYGRAAARQRACAACKHQCRRCSPSRPLAPYFPAEKQQDFLNVHKLFGVNNIVKLLEKVPQHDRDDAMKSIIYEAKVRALNPIGGCCAVIQHLQKQIILCATTELDIVRKNLDFYWARSLPGSNICDQMQGNNQESVGIEMEQQFFKNLIPKVTDSQNQETGDARFLNGES